MQALERREAKQNEKQSLSTFDASFPPLPEMFESFFPNLDLPTIIISHLCSSRYWSLSDIFILLLEYTSEWNKTMEKYLRDNFDVVHKRPSEEALRRWRSAVSIVKNPRRRFRMVADLAKRAEAESKRRSLQVRDSSIYSYL